MSWHEALAVLGSAAALSMMILVRPSSDARLMFTLLDVPPLNHFDGAATLVTETRSKASAPGPRRSGGGRDLSSDYCPAGASVGPASGTTPQVPGVPAPRARPMQARPALQFPLLPVPQHDWPEAPHVPHWLPAVATRQASGVAHATTPPSTNAGTTSSWPNV